MGLYSDSMSGLDGMAPEELVEIAIGDALNISDPELRARTITRILRLVYKEYAGQLRAARGRDLHAIYRKGESTMEQIGKRVEMSTGGVNNILKGN